MKKLMFAAAAAFCGTVSFAELASQNVVGYQQNDMNAGKGFTMAAPMFLTVDSSVDCTLADLSVTGYTAPAWSEEDEEFVGGCKGEFVLRLLTASGTYEGVYYWVDDGENKAGWYKSPLGVAIDGGASSVKIAAGRGMWISGVGYKLVSSGAVNTKLVTFPTNTGKGFTAAGNCMPVDMTLDKFFVTGYTPAVWSEEDEEFVGGCKGEFVLRLLTSSGTYEGVYYWVDDGEKTAGWYKSPLGVAIDGGASSVNIPAGRVLWLSGCGYNFNVPAPAL